MDLNAFLIPGRFPCDSMLVINGRTSSLFTHGRAVEATHPEPAILMQPQPPLQNISNPLTVTHRARNFRAPLLLVRVPSAPVRASPTCCWQGKRKQRFIRPSRITGTELTPRRLKSSSLPSPFPLYPLLVSHNRWPCHCSWCLTIGASSSHERGSATSPGRWASRTNTEGCHRY